MKVILIRHTSVDVPRGTCYGQSDVPVRDTFEEEAQAVKERLSHYPAFDQVYASPLTRARKLAAYCGYPQPRLDNRLKEMYMGRWEMQRFDDIGDPYLQQWYDDFMNLPTPDGESFQTVYRRVAEFLDELKQHDYQRVAVFAHGGVIICAGIYAKLFTTETAWDNQPPYGGIVEIII